MTVAPDGPAAEIRIANDETYADVTVEGRHQRVFGSTSKETRKAALQIITDIAVHTGTDVHVDARDATSHYQLVARPNGVVRALSVPYSSPSTGSRRRPWLLVGVSTAMVLLILGVAGAFVLPTERWTLPWGTSGETSGERAAAEVPAAAPLEGRSAPPGYSEDARWRLPARMDIGPAVSLDGTRMAFLDDEERVRVVGSDGVEHWSAELPLAAPSSDGLFRFVYHDGGQRLVVVGDGEWWMWPETGGEPQYFEAPEGTELSFAGDGPLISDSDEAFVPSDGDLVPVEVPDAMSALATAQGEVLNLDWDGQWAWTSAQNDTPDVIDPDVPPEADEVQRLLTVSDRHVVGQWGAEDEESSLVAVHDAQDGSVVAAATVETEDDLAEHQWVAAAEAVDVGAYGPVLVNLTDGEAEVLEDFEPSVAADGVVYGELDGQSVAVESDGQSVELDEDTARPWGMLDDLAVVAADEYLYALPPE